MQVPDLYKPSTNFELKPCVSGPGYGFGYYDTYRLAHLACATQQEAERASEIANRAYREGYQQAQADIRKVLGVKVS